MLSHLIEKSRKLTVFAFAALLAVSVAACEDGPTEPSDFSQTINSSISSATAFNIHSITTTRAGTFTATVTWPNAAVDLDLWFTNNLCVDDVFLTAGCVIFDGSTAVGVTSETVTGTVTNGQAIRLIVENFAQLGTTNYSIAVTITD